jgi:hypothetical protein
MPIHQTRAGTKYTWNFIHKHRSLDTSTGTYPLAPMFAATAGRFGYAVSIPLQASVVTLYDRSMTDVCTRHQEFAIARAPALEE